MTTLVSSQLRQVANTVTGEYPSGELSGIVPDQAHLEDGGYHCSVVDLRRFSNGNDYSNVRPDDKNLNIEYGAAFDVSVNAADMKKIYARVHAVWVDHSDPRRKFVNAINCWDGSGDAVRLDFYANTATYATDDHKWHTHGEMRRRYVRDDKAARAVISIYAGQTKAAWTEQEEEDDMPTADQVWDEFESRMADPNSNTFKALRAVSWKYPVDADATPRSALRVFQDEDAQTDSLVEDMAVLKAQNASLNATLQEILAKLDTEA